MLAVIDVKPGVAKEVHLLNAITLNSGVRNDDKTKYILNLHEPFMLKWQKVQKQFSNSSQQSCIKDFTLEQPIIGIHKKIIADHF